MVAENFDARTLMTIATTTSTIGLSLYSSKRSADERSDYSLKPQRPFDIFAKAGAVGPMAVERVRKSDQAAASRRGIKTKRPDCNTSRPFALGERQHLRGQIT